MEKLVKNRIYTAVIAGYTHDALGVCEIEGNKVFVPGALKGEKCEILIVKAGNDISYGKLINIIDPSPNRVSPLCPYYRLCGGCSTRHMSYEEELDFKLSRLNSALKHIGMQELICNKIIASDITERYRNKAIFDVSSKDGRAFAGFYRSRTHDVTEISDCLLQKEIFSKIALHTVSFINDHGIKAYDEATGKFTDVTETYEVMIPGQGQQDHPAYGVAVAASEVLEELGIKLQVNDVGTSVWNNALESNTAMMWAAAWQATVDPDMTQVYSSANAHGNGTNSNHYAVDDAELDALIKAGRSSADTEERKSIYKEAMEIIMDWGCELPLYQRKDCTTFSTERIDIGTIPQDMTPYWGWYAEIETMATK